jgi:hypothetical protein
MADGETAYAQIFPLQLIPLLSRCVKKFSLNIALKTSSLEMYWFVLRSSFEYAPQKSISYFSWSDFNIRQLILTR